MASPELQQLIRALEEREIGLGHDDVAWAFESSKTKDNVVSWVQEYVSSANLLTSEELTFYKRNGTAEDGAVQSGHQFSVEDFESTMNSLETSTVALAKQCKLMEAQKQALQEIRARNTSDSQVGGLQAQRSSKCSREKAQVDLEVARLTESLQTRTERSLRQAESSTNSITPTWERMLEKDDRLLDGLEKVLPQLLGPSNGDGKLDEVDRLCQTLISNSRAGVHARIDAAYKTAMKANTNLTNGIHGKDEANQRDSLRAELEELCREIEGLCTMAVDIRFRTPVSKALQAARSDSEREKALWNEYLSATLQYLTGRLETMDDDSQQLRAHLRALKAVSASLECVLAIPMDKKPLSQDNARSPTKVSQRGLKPLRLVQANLSESHDPVTQLLRTFDIRIPDPKNPTQLSGSIGSALNEKHEKQTLLNASSEQGIVSQVRQSLEKADSDIQSLLSAVYAYSPFGTIRLAHQDTLEDIAGLEQKTQTLGKQMRELDVDSVTEAMRMNHQALSSKRASNVT